MKLTPWFPGHIKPVRVGVYQRDYGAGIKIFYSHWDGFTFGSGENTAIAAVVYRGQSLQQNIPWRGVAK